MSNPTDMEIIEAIFKSPENSANFFDKFKPAILGGIICVILSLPIVCKFMESAGIKDFNMYIAKFIIFVVIFYFIDNKK
jgi:hypothetical protein